MELPGSWPPLHLRQRMVAAVALIRTLESIIAPPRKPLPSLKRPSTGRVFCGNLESKKPLWKCVLSAPTWAPPSCTMRSEEHTSELQSRGHLVCRLLLETKKDN